MESTRRSIVKAVLWQLLGVALMMLVGLAITGSLALGGAIAVINAASGVALYFVYERIWARIGWGRHDG